MLAIVLTVLITPIVIALVVGLLSSDILPIAATAFFVFASWGFIGSLVYHTVTYFLGV